MDTNVVPAIASAIASAIAAIASAIAAIASAIAAYLSFRLNKSGYKFNALGKIFEVLNDNAHRNARIRLYIAAKNYYKFRSTDDKKKKSKNVELN